MRIYEVIFILRPEVSEAELDALVGQLTQGVSDTGGKVTKVEKWGKRKLAYGVQGCREGLYVFLEVEGQGDSVRELERRLKVSEPVIKLLSVRMDVERKKGEKLRHRREHRAARRQRAPSSPTSSAEAGTSS